MTELLGVGPQPWVKTKVTLSHPGQNECSLSYLTADGLSMDVYHCYPNHSPNEAWKEQ